MDPRLEHQLLLNRRQLLGRASVGLGSIALATMLAEEGLAAGPATSTAALTQGAAGTPVKSFGGLPGLPHFAPKAKRVIYLFQSGAPSQVDLFDYKPGLAKLRGQEMPASVRMGQQLTTMTQGQKKKQLLPAIAPFRQHGKN